MIRVLNSFWKAFGRMAAAVILFAFLAGAAAAENAPVLRAGSPDRCTETVVSRSGSMGMVLSLPGFWDPSAVTLEIEGAEEFSLGSDRKVIRAGEAADLTAYIGQTVPVYSAAGRNLGRLTVYHGSAVPALFLSVDPQQLTRVNHSKENRITEGRAVFAEADGTVSYAGALTQMKGRGNNTFAYAKKPYQLKLEKKASLAGMNRAKTWVLLANWNDVSLLRNQIVLDLARETGLPCAVSCVQTDVWINGVYNGLYLLAEKVQIKPERIAISDLEDETEELNDTPPESRKLLRKATEELPLYRGYDTPVNPPDITGGYLFAIEKFTRLRDYLIAGFRTGAGLSFRIVEPTYPSLEQTEYLGLLMNDVHQSVIAADGISPQTGRTYREYLDLPSFALKFLIEDWCKNYDFIGGSQYMYKDRDSVNPKIYAGPAWDYDLSFGNMTDRGFDPKGEYLAENPRKTGNLYGLLSAHDDFRSEAASLWKDVFRPAVAVLLGEREGERGRVIRPLDEYAEAIADSAAMNFARWGVGAKSATVAGKSFEKAVRYLENWMRVRTEYMDGAWGTPAP